MTRLRLAGRETFHSLRSRNYRLYFGGQIVSVSGTWMQGVAQAWLVLQLTGSGTVLGLTTALQFLPILLGGAWGGVIADRFDKRRLLLVTQSIAGLLALVLALLTATGTVRLWMVLVLAFAFGCIVAIDNPTRQSFVHDMVGPEDLPNAVTLNSVVVNAARVVGPALAGVLIAGVGIAVCFLLNGLSYLAVLAALAAMRSAELHGAARTPARPGQLREGLRYVWADADLRVPLLVMAVVGTLAYEFQVVLPLMARFVFDGGAGTYGAMSSVMGVGAVIGGLATARRSQPSTGALIRAATVFGTLILGLAVAPTLGVELVLLLAVGAASIVFLATANAALQLRAAPEMRGRVMALWGVAFLGTTPIGGPIVGWIGETYGPRWSLALGGAATLAAAALAARSLRRSAAVAARAPASQGASEEAIASAGHSRVSGPVPRPALALRSRLDVVRRRSRATVRRALPRRPRRSSRERAAARPRRATGRRRRTRRLTS